MYHRGEEGTAASGNAANNKPATKADSLCDHFQAAMSGLGIGCLIAGAGAALAGEFEGAALTFALSTGFCSLSRAMAPD